jgi:hypothetical protein
VSVADAVFEVASHLGSIGVCVGAIACHARLLILTNVLVSKLKVDNYFAIKVASLELTIESAVHVLEVTCSVQLSIFEFSFVVKSGLRAPFVVSFSGKLAIFELTFVVVVVVHVQLALSVKDISEELPFVNKLFATLDKPSEFSLALHLRVYEVANIVTVIRPLELSIAHDLGVFQVASIQEHIFFSDSLVGEHILLHHPELFPLFVAFALHKSSGVKTTAELHSATV